MNIDEAENVVTVVRGPCVGPENVRRMAVYKERPMRAAGRAVFALGNLHRGAEIGLGILAGPVTSTSICAA